MKEFVSRILVRTQSLRFNYNWSLKLIKIIIVIYREIFYLLFDEWYNRREIVC